VYVKIIIASQRCDVFETGTVCRVSCLSTATWTWLCSNQERLLNIKLT